MHFQLLFDRKETCYQDSDFTFIIQFIIIFYDSVMIFLININYLLMLHVSGTCVDTCLYSNVWTLIQNDPIM